MFSAPEIIAAKRSVSPLIIIGGRPKILRRCCRVGLETPVHGCRRELSPIKKKTSTAPSQRLCSSCSDRTLLETDPVGRTAAVTRCSDRQPDPVARCQTAASAPAVYSRAMRRSAKRIRGIRLDVLDGESGRHEGPSGPNGLPQFILGYRMRTEVFKSSQVEGARSLSNTSYRVLAQSLRHGNTDREAVFADGVPPHLVLVIIA